MAKFDPNGASVPNYNRINEWPLQFLRTGYYGRAYGSLSAHTTNGYWWLGTASSVTYGHDLGTWAGAVYSQDSSFRGDGFALRCGAKSKLLTLVVFEKFAIYWAVRWSKY